MKNKIIYLLALSTIVVCNSVTAQNNVGIGTTTPNSNSILEMQSTTQGVLVPRMTTIQRLAIAAPTEGLMVYDIDADCFFFYEATVAAWKNLCSAATGPAGPAGANGTNGTNGISCWDTNGNGVNDPSEDTNGDAAFNALDCAGAAGVAGAAGTNGTNGTNGISCWDTNGNGVNDPSEDINSDGSFNTLDCGGTGTNGTNGTNGINCWDTNGNGINDPAEDTNSDAAFNALDCAGAAGIAGAAGATGAAGSAGSNGANGINCWDTNGNGVNDPSEDINSDGSFNTLDCGGTGTNGTNGTNGINCWDTNGNGVNDPSEDTNGDLAFNALDCKGATGAVGATGPAGAVGATGAIGPAGPTGPIGLTGATGPAGAAGATGPAGPTGLTGPAGPAGAAGAAGATGPTGLTGPAGAAGATGATGATGPQGPQGIFQKYHVYGTGGRANVTSAVATLQPGLTQTFNLAAPATAMIWATIGALTSGAGNANFANVDVIIYVDGNFLNFGGWNRFQVTNPSTTNSFNTCAINTMVNLAAGNHTIELRTARLASSTSAVTIGGNAATETNPGELTILLVN
jgi:hypothetical protein